jgi:hypothetical protein
MKPSRHRGTAGVAGANTTTITRQRTAHSYVITVGGHRIEARAMSSVSREMGWSVTMDHSRDSHWPTQAHATRRAEILATRLSEKRR